MTPTPHQGEVDRILDRYLDPSIDEAERASLRKEIGERDELRVALAQQRRVDAAMRRLFDAPSEGNDAERILRCAAAGKAPRKRFGLLKAAALIAIGSLALWRLWGLVDPPRSDPYVDMSWRSMETVYDDVAADGFGQGAPPFNRDRFARFVRSRFGQEVWVREPADPVSAVGFGFCNTVTEQTMCLITRVPTETDQPQGRNSGGVGVLVFLDRAAADPARALPVRSNLNVFRRTLGQLALYEVSPLSEARVLDLLQEPSGAQP